MDSLLGLEIDWKINGLKLFEQKDGFIDFIG